MGKSGKAPLPKKGGGLTAGGESSSLVDKGKERAGPVSAEPTTSRGV